MRRPWTADDDDLLRRAYRRVALGLIGARLGRSADCCSRRAVALGLREYRRRGPAPPREPVPDEAQVEALAAEVRAGWTEAECRRRAGVAGRPVEVRMLRRLDPRPRMEA